MDKEVEQTSGGVENWDMTDAPKFRGENELGSDEMGPIIRSQNKVSDDETGREPVNNVERGVEKDFSRSETTAERTGENSAEKERDIEKAREQLQEVYSKREDKRVEPLVETPSKPFSTNQPVTKASQALKILKKTTVVTGNTLVTAASVVTVAFFPPSVVALFPVAVLAADAARYAIQGVNGSMFMVDRKHQIKQRLNPFPVLLKHRGQNSSEIFKEETEKLFNGLKPDETYKTTSHALTYSLLRKAEKQGMIYDLAAKKTGKKHNFFFEFLVTGNWDAIKKRKKHSCYDISFKVKNHSEQSGEPAPSQ